MRHLVLLHGFLGHGADWDAVRNRLPGVPTHAPDLPGHGSAVGLPEAAYTMNGAADRVVAGLDAPAVVCGYSMGGRLALHLALRHPEAVAALVLVSASPGLQTEAERAVRVRIDAARARALVADPDAFLTAWGHLPLFETLGEARRRSILAARLAHVDPAEAVRALLGMGTGAQPSHWDALAGIRAPAWAVAGAHDPKFVALATEMAAAGPLTPVLVADAGHALPAEAPDALARLLLRTLDV